MNEQATTNLLKSEELVLSSSPHIHGRDTVRRIMLKVIIALLPALIAAVVLFGLPALRVILVSVVSCVAAEAIWLKLAKKPLTPLGDLSAALTGILLAMNLPAGASWWICVIGSFIAIWVGKQVFGGIGHNIFNPALVGRVALLVALPAALTTWTPTRFQMMDHQAGKEVYGLVDSNGYVTTATPLGLVGASKARHSGEGYAFAKIENKQRYWDYFIGNRPGSLGETCIAALLLGGIALIFMGLIPWQIPVSYIGTVALFTGIVHYISPQATPTPLFHVLSGGLVLGAFFMATDMVTSPMTRAGWLIFGVGCGVLTCVIRLWGGYPEGVSFAILLMNAVVPLIDKLCSLRPFGYVRRVAPRKGGAQ